MSGRKEDVSHGKSGNDLTVECPARRLLIYSGFVIKEFHTHDGRKIILSLRNERGKEERERERERRL